MAPQPASTSPAVIDAPAAAALLAEVHGQPTIANIQKTARLLMPHANRLASVRARMGCVSSFTIGPVEPALQLAALRSNLALETYTAPIGQFDRELIDPGSALSSFQPDVVLFAVRLQDVAPAIYEDFNGLSREKADQLLDEWFHRLGSALQTFRARSPAKLLIQNYDLPAVPALGIADAGASHSQSAVIQSANKRLAEIAHSLENTFVMDYDSLVARWGRAKWADPRTQLYGRIPVAPANYWRLASFYVKHLRPLLGLSKKVLAVDADNTLWGGIVGDAGVGGIALGPDYPGSAYVAFQKRLLDLYHRGVVLCLASKNEPAAVDEVLDKHPSMVLKRKHFAAMRVNWTPKPENLRSIAEELNLGLDSFVFVDDHPVECGLMRATLPQVLTVQMPEEPAEFGAVVDDLDFFDQWTISAEDRRRTEMYAAESGRRNLQATAVDLPTFYRQLDMRITLSLNDPADVARAAQMAARTNQFNMNTIRASEDDIRRWMAAADHDVLMLALADRFADNGVVGMAVIRKPPGEWVLHMLLMSCRVLGRTVEQTFIAWIAAAARADGAARLAAEFAPTPKNKHFSEFYPSCGFTKESDGGATQRWVLPLDKSLPTIPEWMQVQVRKPDGNPT